MIQKKGTREPRKQKARDIEASLLLYSTQIDVTGHCVAEASVDWRKTHAKSTPRNSKDSVQSLKPFAFRQARYKER
jgi:hypothetical protein